MKLDKRVTALGALRIASDGNDVMYDGRGIVHPSHERRYAAVEQLCRQACGGDGLRDYQDGDYAILDGYDDEGDMVASYGLTRGQFKFLYRKLGWRKLDFDLKPVDSPSAPSGD
jgi:hypothetical protein